MLASLLLNLVILVNAIVIHISNPYEFHFCSQLFLEVILLVIGCCHMCFTEVFVSMVALLAAFLSLSLF
jgi:hypothetical protein